MSKRKNLNKYNKTWITWFRKNKTKELYDEVLSECISEHNRCKCCGGPIYYYDSIFRINKNYELYPDGKSYLTEKTLLGNKYYLSVCEDCLTKKYPEYQNLNKSRIFNRICDITNYAFNIPEIVSNEWKQQNYSVTLDNLIIKHGEEEGNKIWIDYCRKQSETNTFKYKKEKYGWTKTQFKEYNKSRSTTIKNFIKKYGELEGIEKWNKYIDRQRYTCSLEYFIEKYGNNLGQDKFDKYAKNRTNFFGYSNISRELFDKIVKKLNRNYRYYYADDEYIIGPYLLDFYIKELNISIEYNGNIWHANPKFYESDDKPNPFNKNLTASDIWLKDKIRSEEIKKHVNETFIIWEDELKEKGLEQLSDELVKKIKNYV
ncbi:hypothetical protein M0Q97_02080 [Candidatus Dojkabacteria bacterium]|jgi:hypothetical protein|nr:hypothetical protein [Candidatus Dojkabacteria bacterium]